ncbi:unnamed protein product (macronuclear) [Paramecium tetraurelia]|uniref:Uncharacterized protein n=1 Tax=Paramecium tetraurelia TaxID=5888 RepID=A0DP16_PARTE|nr:uncharacterized protein GSPATT00018979001 [Paramecium tetraurelia]CAK84783.1 unnamed protein product [Paramecium tetraurelia]|eukprot:XP_001452180.1 hypothetical protein (macronuclear) [Paramecium tetraurelia strain d4-2]
MKNLMILEALKSYGIDDIVPIPQHISLLNATYKTLALYQKYYIILNQIIEAFTPKQIMTGILGYYLVTTMGCYQRILLYEKFSQVRQTLQKAQSEIERVISQLILIKVIQF